MGCLFALFQVRNWVLLSLQEEDDSNKLETRTLILSEEVENSAVLVSRDGNLEFIELLNENEVSGSCS